MRRPSRIAAAALGVLSIWWVLWSTIETGPPRDPHAGDPSPASGGEASSGAARSTDDAAALVAGSREPLASTEIARPPEAPATEAVVLIQLAGTLTDAVSHDPIRTASLRLVDSGWEERTAKTDVSGGYAFGDLRPGTWELTVESLGHRTLRRIVELASAPTDQRLDLALVPGEILKVKIVGGVDLDRVVVPGRSRSGQREARSSIVPMVTREEPGRWMETDPVGGPAIAGGFLSRTKELFAGEGWAWTRDEERLEALGYGKRRGRVESRDLARIASPLPDGTKTSDLPAEYCGVFVLTEPPPVFACLVFRDFVLQTRAVPAGTDQVVFSLTAEDMKALVGVVQLRVVDGESEDRPRGLRVRLDTGSSEHEWKRKESSDGSITILEVLPGRALLTITADDREPVIERVLVEPVQVTSLGPYRLQPLSSIRAKVIDSEGEPVQVYFNVFPMDRYTATRTTLDSRYFRSSPDGELKIDSVGRGRYLILAHEEGWVSTPALADTTLGNAKGIVIRVSKGTPVSLRLRADPLPAARLSIRTRDGLPVTDRRCRDRDPMRFLLAPGSYSVELWDGETWLASETLAVGAEPVQQYFPR